MSRTTSNEIRKFQGLAGGYPPAGAPGLARQVVFGQGVLLRALRSLTRSRDTLLVVAGCLVAYELVTDGFVLLDPMLFPGLGKVAIALVDSLPQLTESFFSSMGLLIPGYLIGAVSGIVLGILVALHPRVNRALKPIIFALSPMPPSMLTPYLIAVMPTFYGSSVGIIFLGVFWPYLSSTIVGITLIDQKYLDNAKILELSGVSRLFYVILPAAAPHILSGAGTALTFSFILLTVAEMFATDSGLGHFVQYYADFSEYARVLAGLFYTAVVFVGIMLIYERIKEKILFWMLNTDSRS